MVLDASHTGTEEQSDNSLEINETDQGQMMRILLKYMFYFFLTERPETVGTVTDNEKFAGKILLISSIVLTKGLISTCIRSSASKINEALGYLLNKKLLLKHKYLQSGNRPVEAYLKCLPENLESRINKYLLQRDILDVQVNVDSYINSMKIITYATTSQRPTDLLINVLQTAPYDQLHIDLSTKRKGIHMYEHILIR